MAMDAGQWRPSRGTRQRHVLTAANTPSLSVQWSRLLARTPLSSASSRKDFAKDPARRLHRFEKEYSQLLVRHACHHPQARPASTLT